MHKYNNQLMEVPVIGGNLLNIIKILKEEERSEIQNVVDSYTNINETATMSESLEFFV